MAIANKYWIALVLLVFSLPVFGKNDTLVMKEGVYEDISLYYRYCLQPAHKTAKDLIPLLADTSIFTRPPKQEEVFHRQEQNGVYWIYVTVQWNDDYAEQLLYNFYNDGVVFTLFEVKGDSIKTYPAISAASQLNKRLLQVRSSTYPLLFKPFETKHLLLRVERSNGFFYFPIDITTTKDYLEFEIPYTLSIGKYIGYFLFAFLFHLVLWFIVKAPTNFWQSAYILCIVLFSLYDYGLDVFTLPNGMFSYFARLPKTWYLLLAATCTLQVSYYFLNVRELLPKLAKLVKLIHIINLLLVFVIAAYCGRGNILSEYYQVLFLDIYIVFVFFCVAGICILGVIQKQQQAILYSIAFLPVFFSVEIFQIHGITELRFPIISPGNVMVSFAWEILFQTILFIANFKQIIIQKEQLAQTKLLNEKEIQRQYILAQEEERARLASDLHDDLGGTISGIKLRLSNLPNFEDKNVQKQLNQLQELVAKANQDLRSISHDLTPKNFDFNNLIDNIQKRVQELNNEQPTKFTLIHNNTLPTLEKTAAIHVYRIINECITNIIKHAQATQAIINITYNETLQIAVTDNGVGIPNNANSLAGIGLKNIQSRTSLLNGTMEILSNPQQGTSVIFEIPIPSTT